MVGKADFASCPFPDGQPTMIALCQFASIIEDAVDSIYNRRTDSLRQLYAKAEALYAQCRRHGEKWGLGSVVPVQQKTWNAETTLLMHSGEFPSLLSAPPRYVQRGRQPVQLLVSKTHVLIVVSILSRCPSDLPSFLDRRSSTTVGQDSRTTGGHMASASM